MHDMSRDQRRPQRCSTPKKTELDLSDPVHPLMIPFDHVEIFGLDVRLHIMIMRKQETLPKKYPNKFKDIDDWVQTDEAGAHEVNMRNALIILSTRPIDDEKG